MANEIRIRPSNEDVEDMANDQPQDQGGPFGSAGGDRPYLTVLEALNRVIVDSELTDIESNSKARRSMADIKREELETEQSALAQARDDLAQFRAALDDAWQRRSAPVAVYDAANASENAYVDALIRYLVRAGYAEAHAEEQADGHYVYEIRVDWPRVRALASSAAGA